MSHITPLSNEELGEQSFLIDAIEKNMGFVPNSIKTMARLPAIMGSFAHLSGLLLGNPEKTSPWLFVKLTLRNMKWAAAFMKRKDRIPLQLRNLVAYVSSNAAGCQYCQAHSINEATHNGVSDDKLAAVWDFENSELFTEEEKAALRFGLAAGSCPNSVTKTHFQDLKKHFSEDQIIELGAIVALFGFLNRWNDSFATELEELPFESANKHLSKNGWSPGKHAPIE